MKIKNNILMILGIIMIVFSSIASVYATSYLYNADEVGYTPPSGSSITSTNVQGAIDDLYTLASNYSNLKSRVDTLKTSYVGHHNFGTFNQETLYCYGFITSGQTSIWLSCPIILPDKVTTITATSITAQIRSHNGAYLVSSGAEIKSYCNNISYKKEQGILSIGCTKSDKWNFTNNTNFGGWIAITFTAS